MNNSQILGLLPIALSVLAAGLGPPLLRAYVWRRARTLSISADVEGSYGAPILYIGFVGAQFLFASVFVIIFLRAPNKSIALAVLLFALAILFAVPATWSAWQCCNSKAIISKGVVAIHYGLAVHRIPVGKISGIAAMKRGIVIEVDGGDPIPIPPPLSDNHRLLAHILSIARNNAAPTNC